MGQEPMSKWYCMCLLVIPQIWLSWATAGLSWPAYLLVAYVAGATITQGLFLAIHELSHNLFFKKPLHNRYFAMVVNFPIGPLLRAVSRVPSRAPQVSGRRRHR